jgi:hypothetical protein
MYLDFLELTSPEYDLYLAISELVYTDFFEQRATQVIVQRHHLKLLIVDIDEEVIVTWRH